MDKSEAANGHLFCKPSSAKQALTRSSYCIEVKVEWMYKIYAFRKLKVSQELVVMAMVCGSSRFYFITEKRSASEILIIKYIFNIIKHLITLSSCTFRELTDFYFTNDLPAIQSGTSILLCSAFSLKLSTQ